MILNSPPPPPSPSPPPPPPPAPWLSPVPSPASHVGLEVTKEPLHQIVAVDDIIDPALRRHTYPSYSNEVYAIATYV